MKRLLLVVLLLLAGCGFDGEYITVDPEDYPVPEGGWAPPQGTPAPLAEHTCEDFIGSVASQYIADEGMELERMKVSGITEIARTES